LFTLFVVPAVYLLLAADHHSTAVFAGEGGAPEPHAVAGS
jgi:hypothetical protein